MYAIEGRFIQELQGDNPFLTMDPEKAHVFFLPFSVAMMVTYLYRLESHDFVPLERFVKDYVHVITQRHPFWNRSSGADHFMLTCHDWGPHLSPRVVEAMYNDCVPVIIADSFILPFSDVLNWKSFSFCIAERDIPNLKDLLQAPVPVQSTPTEV